MFRSFLLLVAAVACHAAVPHATALFHPDSASMNAPCPHTYTVLFHTTKGNFEVQVEQAWAPNGAQRFYNLVKNGKTIGIDHCTTRSLVMLVLKVFTTMLPFFVPYLISWSNLAFLETLGLPRSGKVRSMNRK